MDLEYLAIKCKTNNKLNNNDMKTVKKVYNKVKTIMENLGRAAGSAMRN